MSDDADDIIDDGEEGEKREKRARLTKKGLVAEVAARTGLSRRDASKAADAVLEAIRDAIDTDKDVLAPPLGRLSPGKLREGKTGARTRVLRLRIGRADTGEDATEEV